MTPNQILSNKNVKILSWYETMLLKLHWELNRKGLEMEWQIQPNLQST